MGKYRSDDIFHSGLYFFCCEANDRLGGCLPWYGLGAFLEFSFLRVNINTLLGNPNLIYSENPLSLFRGRKQLDKPR